MTAARRVGATLVALCTLVAGAAAEGLRPGHDRRLDLPAAPTARAAQSAMLAVAAAGGAVVAAGERGMILRSSDCGATWRQAVVPVGVTLTALQFVDERQGWAVGHGGVVLATRDGGATWQKQLDGRAIATLARQAAEALAATATAADAQRALSDAERLAADGPDKPLFALHFWTPQRGMVVGAYGLALATEDGGAHWQWAAGRIPNPKGLHLYGLWASGDLAYLVGEQGMVARSDDGGRRFQALPSPYAGSYFGVAGAGQSGGAAPELLIYGLRGHAFHVSTQPHGVAAIDTGVHASVLTMLARADSGALLFDADGQIAQLQGAGKAARMLGNSPVGPVLGAAPACGGKLVVAGLRGLAAIDPASMAADGKGHSK